MSYYVFGIVLVHVYMHNVLNDSDPLVYM